MSRPPPTLVRGIDPETLLLQVRSTAAYVFDLDGKAYPPAQVLRASHEKVQAGAPLSHTEYFQLCYSAHYSTCATPVPTDVDNQIRFKLWSEALPASDALEMARFVLDSLNWDFRYVSRRFTEAARASDAAGESVSGNRGEWFTVACAAYCALLRPRFAAASELVQMRRTLFDAISGEVDRHSKVFGSLWKANDGLGCLKASASLAHNFGDLDRVMDMWSLDVADPLRLKFYKLGISPFDAEGELRFNGRLWVAGELYKSVIESQVPGVSSSMALENHRHFALRKPRCLRESVDRLIPIGPFFDDWGRTLARSLAKTDGTPSEQTHEVVLALKHGWDRLPKSVGYGRALRSFLDVHPGLEIEGLLPGDLRRRGFDVTQAAFEKIWNGEALRLMDEIPSRA